ncbi:Uncharacterised protein [uncultured archaeon]|nr:Uncharacterised protein [uncultured archaeon]
MDFSFITNLASDKLLLFLFIFLVCLIILWILIRLFKKNPSEQKQNISIAFEEKKVEELKKEVLKPIPKDFNASKEVLPELKPEKEEKQKLVSFEQPQFQQVVWPRVTPTISIPSTPEEGPKPEEKPVLPVPSVKPAVPEVKPDIPKEKPKAKKKEVVKTKTVKKVAKKKIVKKKVK